MFYDILLRPFFYKSNCKKLGKVSILKNTFPLLLTLFQHHFILEFLCSKKLSLVQKSTIHWVAIKVGTPIASNSFLLIQSLLSKNPFISIATIQELEKYGFTSVSNKKSTSLVLPSLFTINLACGLNSILFLSSKRAIFISNWL